MKLLIRFFIALYIFLLSGYAQLHATGMYKDCVCNSHIYNLDGSIHAGLSVSLQDADCLTYKTALSKKDKVDDKIDTSDNEEENDEQVSVKKLLDANKYFVIAFGGQTSGLFYQDIKKSLPSCKLFSNFTSYKRYIIFRVIRI